MRSSYGLHNTAFTVPYLIIHFADRTHQLGTLTFQLNDVDCVNLSRHGLPHLQSKLILGCLGVYLLENFEIRLYFNTFSVVLAVNQTLFNACFVVLE